jgi:ribonuclease P protein component
VPGGAEAGFPRRERLTAGADYRRVFRTGLRLDGPLFALVAVRNDRGYWRLGLAASRGLGGATRRNRAKRLARETFRRHKVRDGASFDLVLVLKPAMVASGLVEVEREYRERLRRLAARGAARRRGPAAPAGR